MDIKTLQEWILYAEDIEQTAYNGEEVYEISLVFRKELIDRIETICNHGNERDMRFRNLLLKDLGVITSDSRSSNKDSLNTDYDFGSKKEPQPKGKDATYPSHNQ